MGATAEVNAQHPCSYPRLTLRSTMPPFCLSNGMFSAQDPRYSSFCTTDGGLAPFSCRCYLRVSDACLCHAALPQG